jgi:hypothetical protein
MHDLRQCASQTEASKLLSSAGSSAATTKELRRVWNRKLAIGWTRFWGPSRQGAQGLECVPHDGPLETWQLGLRIAGLAVSKSSRPGIARTLAMWSLRWEWLQP